MAQLEGTADPRRVAQEQRRAAIQAMVAKHRGKRVSQLSVPAQAELLEALAQAMGLADEDGRIG